MIDYQIKQISAGFIIISDGKILLGKSSNVGKKRSWGVFKGKIEEGEGTLEAASRELLEESGLDILGSEYLQKCISTVPVVEYIINKGKKKVVLFLLNDHEKRLLNFDFKCDPVNGKIEVSDFKWFSKNEANQYIFRSQLDVLEFLD